MWHLINFIIAFNVFCIGYLFISSCPSLGKWYLDKRDSPIDWVFLLLTVMLSLAGIVVLAFSTHAFYVALDIPKGYGQATGLGCFSAIVFMTWINYRKRR